MEPALNSTQNSLMIYNVSIASLFVDLIATERMKYMLDGQDKYVFMSGQLKFVSFCLTSEVVLKVDVELWDKLLILV